jgi:uncharacterized protein YlzI (FlbEa/FlbD family)
MSNFIELTNIGNEELKGDPILLNPNHITSVYEVPTDGGSRRTLIYCSYKDIAWSVEESYSEVKKKIKEASNA